MSKKSFLVNNFIIYNALGQTLVIKRLNGIAVNKFFKKIYFFN